MTGLLQVVRGADEIFVTVREDGSVTARNGHVDLGTGITTALAQIVAEELDVALERVSFCSATRIWCPTRVRPSPARPSR